MRIYIFPKCGFMDYWSRWIEVISFTPDVSISGLSFCRKISLPAGEYLIFENNVTEGRILSIGIKKAIY